MVLVEKHDVKRNSKWYKELDKLCYLSKNLYNATLYTIRQHFFRNGKCLGYNQVNKQFQDENNPDYRALPSKVAQHTQRLVVQNFTSFFALLKKKTEGQYDKPVRIPKYLHKTKGRQVVHYTSQAVSFNCKTVPQGYIKLSGTEILIKTKVDNVQFVRVIHKGYKIIIEVGYNKEVVEKTTSKEKFAAIDIGLNNLATVTFSEEKGFIVNGKPLKSINQYFNKKYSQLKSKQNLSVSWRMQRLSNKRNNKITDYLHKASRYIVNQLVSKGVTDLVIGHNKGWKQDINMGKVNNQNFVSIPFNRLIEMVSYKCELSGIRVYLQEESYTSKASFLDLDQIPTFDATKVDLVKHKFSGKRVKRGLYKSRDKSLINADVNGSLNIMRKYLKVAEKNIMFDFVEASSAPAVFTVKL